MTTVGFKLGKSRQCGGKFWDWFFKIWKVDLLLFFEPELVYDLLNAFEKAANRALTKMHCS